MRDGGMGASGPRSASRGARSRGQSVTAGSGNGPAHQGTGDAPAVGYRIFGPLAIAVDGEVHGLSRRRERTILAMLIAAHRRPVSVERLVDQLWAGDPPPRARVSLQVAISRLRGVIEPQRERGAPSARLVSVAGGYALNAADDDVDGWRFERAARTAVGAQPSDCGAASEAALASWQGMPFADCADTDLVRSEVDRLLETRLSLIEARAEALLALGHPEAVARELPAAAREHPFRERLWSLLAISQYQTLRQADALATLRILRERLFR